MQLNMEITFAICASLNILTLEFLNVTTSIVLFVTKQFLISILFTATFINTLKTTKTAIKLKLLNVDLNSILNDKDQKIQKLQSRKFTGKLLIYILALFAKSLCILKACLGTTEPYTFKKWCQNVCALTKKKVFFFVWEHMTGVMYRTHVKKLIDGNLSEMACEKRELFRFHESGQNFRNANSRMPSFATMLQCFYLCTCADSQYRQP